MAKAKTELLATATRLAEHLRELRHPAFWDHYPSLARRAAKEDWGDPE